MSDVMLRFPVLALDGRRGLKPTGYKNKKSTKGTEDRSLPLDSGLITLDSERVG